MSERRAITAGSGRSGEAGAVVAATAGELLVAARGARGLSIEAVAQQLKLSPRQVRALEQGDYGLLPGRTFVRGFVRNYARLVGLDPEHVLAALPGGAATPALEAPALHPTAAAMGELPTAERAKAPWTRWAIPVLLAVVVATAAIYEWTRPLAASRAHPVAKEGSQATEAHTAPPVAERTETPLPNPLLVVPAPAPAQGVTPVPPAPAQGDAPSAAEPAQTKGATNAS